MREFYKILEIPRSATDEEIKKAYRKQALKWHPDKNRENHEVAEARFKEIAEAYEVLSNKEKREVYDRCGKEGLISQNGATEGEGFSAGDHIHVHIYRSPDEIFREFFGPFDPFEDFFASAMFSDSLFKTEPHTRRRRQNRGSTRRRNPHQLFMDDFEEPEIAFIDLNDDFGTRHQRHYHSMPCRRRRHRHFHGPTMVNQSFCEQFPFRSQNIMMFSDPFIQMERQMQEMNELMSNVFGRF